MATNINPLVLNPDDEFESVLVDIVKMHRKKSQLYGTDADPLWNFYDGSQRLSLHPLIVAESYRTKHESALAKWRHEKVRNLEGLDGTAVRTVASDDGMLDRAVYDVLELVLYRRHFK